MIPRFPMGRAERDHFRVPGSPTGQHYRAHRPENINMLPSIGSMFGPDLGRSGAPPVHGTTPGVLGSQPYSYPPDSPIQTPGPPALSQYLSSRDDPWGTHKQGQHPSTPLATIRYQKTHPEYAQPQHSPNNVNFPDGPRRADSWNAGYINQIRSDRAPMSPTTETTISYQDTYSNMESGTDMYSDQGESEINSGIGDTQSQAGSTVSGMYLRQFACKTCKLTFKCDSLRRKHEMKHTKPFKCQFPDCKRKGQGFTSANDRDRHMNSVHKRHFSRPAVGYDCCYDHCHGNGKIFWRLDNFRNHLKKKHDPKGSKEQLEEFLKRAEADCRRVQPPGTDISMDTRSEPEYPMSHTSMESPGPAMSVDFHLPRQPRRIRLPPVPRFPGWESASESGGIGQPPISPVSRGPHPDLGSDSGDRMDIDEIPESIAATSHPRAVELPPDTERTNGPQFNGSLSHASSKVPPERQEQGKEGYTQAPDRAENRSRRLRELFERIKEIPRLLTEFNSLCDEERDDDWGAGMRYHLVPMVYSPSEASGRTMPASYSQNNEGGRFQENTTHESQLGRIEESCPDRMDRDDFRHSRTSHSLQAFITQDPAEESVMSRLLSSSGTAPTVTPSSSTQVDTQALPRQLVSPPISVASPQATATEVSQAQHHHQQKQKQAIVIPDDEPPTRSSLRSPPHGITLKHGAPGGQPTHTLLPQNGKSTICPECDKVFTMPSKLKKHMKRHSRPYACTFRGCGKLFGSKNDWKRHENSQHFQLELWKCGVIPLNSNTLCGKLSFRRESHITHLRSIHGITDKNEVTTKTAEAHIGRNNFKTFWCGFCPSVKGQDEPRGLVVHLEKKGLGGWDERFDHLGKHFIDDGLKINRYKFHDDDEYGPTQPSSDDEEDGEMTAAEPTKQPQNGKKDFTLENYDISTGSNTGQKVVACTAPDGEKSGVEQAKDELGPKTVITKLPSKLRPSVTRLWYCCKQCPDTGPYMEALVTSCISCEHPICKNCKRERPPLHSTWSDSNI